MITSINPYAAFGTYMVTKTYTFSATGAAALSLFTVTGDVIVRVIPVATVNVVPAGANYLLRLGVVGNDDAMITDTDLTTDPITAEEIWLDPSPDSEIEPLDNIRNYVITGGNDIIMTNSNTITSGAIKFYCIVTRLSDDANVQPA